MEHIVLKATKRDVVGKQVGALRRQGKLPAVLYGHHIETTPILLDAYEGSQTLSYLTSSSLVTIDLDGKQFLAQVREKQRDYLKNRLLHVDFQVVSLTEKMRAKVGIELSGTAPAVKNFKAVIHRPDRAGGRVHPGGPAAAHRGRHLRPGRNRRQRPRAPCRPFRQGENPGRSGRDHRRRYRPQKRRD